MNEAINTFNWRQAAPGLSAIVGLVVLFVTAVIITQVHLGMALIVIGGTILVGGYVYALPSPLLLILPHLGIAIFLVLQSVGVCQAGCGHFIEYQRIFGFQTVMIGAVIHVAAFVGGILFMRGRFVNAGMLRFVMGMCQGTSLYFVIIMATNGHWCPSCAASHALMLAQAVMVWRVTEHHHRTIWLSSVLIGGLGLNAAFHHHFDKPMFGPSEELLGYLHAQRQDGKAIAVAIAGDKVSTGTAPAPIATNQSGAIKRDAGHRNDGPLSSEHQKRLELLTDNGHMRTGDFFMWGSSDAPVVIRAHMDLVCPGCRVHWPQMDKIRKLINGRKASINLMMSWPISPDPHYGAKLGTYAVYSAGFLGEEEMLAALERFYSPEGFAFLNTVHANLLGMSAKGKIPEDTLTDALIATFKFMEPAVSATKALQAYAKHKPEIDGNIQANMQWLVQNGNFTTPVYYFTKTGQTGRPLLNVSTLDPEVWTAFINRSSL